MGGTTLPILVQDLTLNAAATDTEDIDSTPVISAVDLTRAYVYIPGHESGEISCDGITPPSTTGPGECNPTIGGGAGEGFNTDGQVQQWCVEMPDDGGGIGTSMRVFRQGAPGALPAGAPGCPAQFEKVLVVEYT